MVELTAHSHDDGLPPQIIRKRKQARHVARWMLTVAVLTAIPGWALFSWSVISATRVGADNIVRPIVAYGLLIISSVTLVLGLWYLLLAQVRRIARMVGEDEVLVAHPQPVCPNCGWPRDIPDRFCRHCGKALPAMHDAAGSSAA